MRKARVNVQRFLIALLASVCVGALAMLWSYDNVRESMSSRYLNLFATPLTSSRAFTSMPVLSRPPNLQVPEAFETSQRKGKIFKTSCRAPVDNIAFIKTHKTGSSSVQNALFRYGENRKLRFALTTATGDIRFNYPEVFRAEFVRKGRRDSDEKAPENNIICHHMRFRYQEVKRVVPKDTRFVTILREPGELFESTFNYFHSFVTAFHLSPDPFNLTSWLEQASNYFENGRSRGTGGMWFLAKSGTFFDLGYDNLVDHQGYIDLAISQMEEQFDLVMIADYFDESMILLKELMCWSMNDIVTLKHNVRVRKTKISPETAAKVREWNKADAALFDHFNRSLWEKIKNYGTDRMRKDVTRLRELTAEWKNYCVRDIVSSGFFLGANMIVPHPKQMDIKAYIMRPGSRSNHTCQRLTWNEDEYSNFLSVKQDGRRF